MDENQLYYGQQLTPISEERIRFKFKGYKTPALTSSPRIRPSRDLRLRNFDNSYTYFEDLMANRQNNVISQWVATNSPPPSRHGRIENIADFHPGNPPIESNVEVERELVLPQQGEINSDGQEPR